MSKEEIFNKKLAEDLANLKKNSIKPETPAMEQYLVAGYAPDILSLEQAEMIIAEWKKDHQAYPYPLYRKALAFCEGYHAKPTVKDITHPPTDHQGNIIAAS